MTIEEPLLQVDLPGIRRLKSGKVREVFDLGESYLIVATDRISAFDCVMPNGIPGKGAVLTRLSHFWFDRLARVVPNHRLLGAMDPLPDSLRPFSDWLQNRSMVVRKARPLPIECVVRGYLAGSGWQEYQRSGTVCGVRLPAGLREADRLNEAIFTPATKAEEGHDENISFEAAEKLVGGEIAGRVRDLSIRIYEASREFAATRGILIADTKFEFGLIDGELTLIDEVLTPDSSRFWPADSYEPGRGQLSFDKQFVRDYLMTLNWDRTPPAPALPPDVVRRTREKYLDVFERLTGKTLEAALEHGARAAGKSFSKDQGRVDE